jgi:hypothetical protein
MTTQQLDTAITAIAAVTASVTGIDAAPAFAIYNVRENIFALHYPVTSSIEVVTTGSFMELAMIACDILTPFVDVMNTDTQAILQIAQAVRLAYISETVTGGDFFSNTINACPRVSLTFMPNYIYGNMQYIGYRVMLEEAKLIYDL